MFWYFLPIILLYQKAHPILNEIKEITVKTLYDYQIQMDKDQVLNIIIPANTFIFISSNDGYKATIYKTNNFLNSIGDLVPNSTHRLIYFEEEGSMMIVSTISNLIFTFHSLPINQISSSSKKFNLVVSSDPNQTFILSQRQSYFDLNQFSNYDDTLFWLISDQITSCKVNGNITYYISNDNEDDENKISSKNVYYDVDNFSEPITGKSKVFKLEWILFTYSIRYSIISEINNDQSVNYYHNYRTYVNKSSLQGTTIIERGKDDFYVDFYLDDLKEGLFSIDFSITRKVYLKSTNSLILYLTQANVEINDPNDDIYAQCFGKSYTQIVSKSQPISKNEINYTCFNFNAAEHTDIYFSTLPTNFFKIGSIFNRVVNYTNDIGPVYYIVPCLQNIITQIIGSRSNTIYKINYGGLEEENITKNTNVTGPFLIRIPKAANFTFNTYYEGEYNDDFPDIHHYFYGKNDNSFYLSKKYGMYDIIDMTVRSSYTKYGKLNIYDTLKVKSNNMVYIKNDKWKGEIIDPVVPEEIKEFGPHLGKRFFYAYNISNEEQTCTFILYNMGMKLNTIYLAQSNTYDCDKMIAFNQHPSTFNILSKNGNNAKTLAVNESMCFFQLFVYANYNYTVSNDGNDADIKHYGNSYPNNNLLRFRSLSEEMEININYFVPFDSDWHLYAFDFYQTMFTNEFFNGDYKLYSEFDINKATSVYYIENQIPEDPIPTPIPEEPETFNGDEYEIIQNGFKYVDMNNKETFKIKCKNTTLLYIHNVDDINVDAYSNGELFGTINSSSFDRILYFADEGEVIITKKTNSENLQLFYSYIYPCKFDAVYVCSKPITSIKIGKKNTDKIDYYYCTFGETNSGPVYIWFTYPYETNIKVTKYLYNDHYISINGQENLEIKEVFSNYTVKDALITIERSYNEFDTNYYTNFVVKNLSQVLLSEDTTKYDIVQQLVEINKTSSSILFTKPHVVPKEPPPKDPNDNLGIIVVIVCCVGGVIIIVVIVVVVVVVKKRKKKAKVSASLEDNSENENKTNNENENEDKNE